VTIEGYEVTGPVAVVSTRIFDSTCVTVFVQRSTLPGRPWLRFTRKYKDGNDAAPPEGEWWVKTYKTKREAIAGKP